MAVFSATDYTITVAGTDLSDHCANVDTDFTADQIDSTAFGDEWREMLGGTLKTGTVSFNFHQDYAASSVDSVLWTNFGTIVTVVLKPTSSAVSATNPSLSFSVLISQIKPVSAQVGDQAVQQVTWPVSGTVTRATS